MIRRGKGVASMFYPVGGTSYPSPSLVTVNWNIDGSAFIYTGAADIGQGAMTALAQIASKSLGVSYDKITMVCADTMMTAYDTGPVASRQTYVVGNAIKLACEDAKRKLLEIAAVILDFPEPAGLRIEDDVIFADAFTQCRIGVADALEYALKVRGRPINGTGVFNPATSLLKGPNGQGKPFGAHVFATQIAIVDVDDETGWYDVKRVYAVHDCGKAINPMMVLGQICGGVGMGLGYGKFEEMVLQQGKVLNAQFTDYVLPTAMDTPEIIADFIERPEPTGPYGAKAIGEPSMLPTAPAIANAVYDAVGVLITDLPVTPEKIVKALQEKDSAQPLHKG